MAEARRSGRPGSYAAVNQVPAGLLASDEWASLTARQREVATAVAMACGPADRDGHLRGAFGGLPLADRCGVGRGGLWRHLNTLLQKGIIVRLARGGTLRLSIDGAARNLANVYGVPAYIGGLDGEAVRGDRFRIRSDAAGVRHRERMEAGDQCTLWSRRDCEGESASESAAAARRERRVSSASGRRRGVGHVTIDMLRADDAIAEVIAGLSRRGVIGGGEDEAVAVCAAAERALRVGKNPPALFAWLVGGRRWLLLAAEDMDRGGRRWGRIVRRPG